MSNELPLVTVVVPCYNHEKYLEQCIDSIFRQTYKNIEVIIVDDCSTDSSVDVIKQLQQKYKFIFIEHSMNFGLTKTLNEVIFNYAKGKYIKCIASDDYLADECVEILIREIEKIGDEYAFVYGQARAFHYNLDCSITYRHVIGRGCEDFVSLYTQKPFNPVPAMAVLFSRDKYRQVGGCDPSCYIEDFSLWLMLASKYKIKFVKHIVAYYQTNSGNSMSKNSIKMYVSGVQIMTKTYLQNQNIIKEKQFFDNMNYQSADFIIRDIKSKIVINKMAAIQQLFKHLLLLIYCKKWKFIFTFVFRLVGSDEFKFRVFYAISNKSKFIKFLRKSP